MTSDIAQAAPPSVEAGQAVRGNAAVSAGRLVPWSPGSARIGCTPLVRVRLRIQGRWQCLWLKLEQFNRGGSIKDRTAYSLIEDIEERGLMRDADTIVESTSGNLGIGLALACRERGYRFVAVVDPMTSGYCIDRMKELGARIEVVRPVPQGEPFLALRLSRVRELRLHEPGLVWTNQYGNLANPRVHRNHTGAEIVRQLDECPEAVFVAVSTGGTLKGISQYLRAFAPQSTMAAVDVTGSVVLGGQPGQRNVPGIGSSRPSDFLRDQPYDMAFYVSEEDAVAACNAVRACTNIGLGGSSGAVVVAAARFMRAMRPSRPVVCVCPDGSDRYEDSVYNPEWRRRKGFGAGALSSLPFDDIDCN